MLFTRSSREARVKNKRLTSSDRRPRRTSAARSAVVVTAVTAVLLPLAPSAQAEQAHPSSVQARFAALGTSEQARYGIRELHWVPAAGGVPGYEFVLGCFDCAGATYDATGALTNPTVLSRIPVVVTHSSCRLSHTLGSGQTRVTRGYGRERGARGRLW